MSGSVNKAIVLGNLGRDPEVRFVGEQAVCNFSIATSESWTDKASGTKKEKVEWHRIVVWGKLAELCGQYLKKGRQAYVEGRLQTREWEKDGKKNFTTEVVANAVVFLGGKGEADGTSAGPPSRTASEQPSDSDDIPF